MLNKAKIIKKKLIDKATTITSLWSPEQMENMTEWFNLAYDISAHVEKLSNGTLSGVDKGIYVTEAVVSIARSIWKKHTNNLNEQKINKLKNGSLKIVWLIMENPMIIQGSTTLTKKILNLMDENKDGEISKKECCNFFKCGFLFT